MAVLNINQLRKLHAAHFQTLDGLPCFLKLLTVCGKILSGHGPQCPLPAPLPSCICVLRRDKRGRERPPRRPNVGPALANDLTMGEFSKLNSMLSLVKMLAYCHTDSLFAIDLIRLSHQADLVVPPSLNKENRCFKLGFSIPWGQNLLLFAHF